MKQQQGNGPSGDKVPPVEPLRCGWCDERVNIDVTPRMVEAAHNVFVGDSDGFYAPSRDEVREALEAALKT